MHKLLFLLTLFCSCLFSYCCAYQYELALLAVFQNESRFLQEWLEFHKLVGVQHFYLINHFSSDSYYPILEPYIAKGEVELFHCDDPSPPHWETYQSIQYTKLLPKLQREAKWVAVIDVDEFLFPVKQRSLRKFLKNYDREEIAALWVNWQCYGTSFVAEVTSHQLMTHELNWRAKSSWWLNKFGKCIIRPQKTLYIGVHGSQYLQGYCVNSRKNFFEVKPTIAEQMEQPLDISEIRINHYWTKDEKNYREIKKPRYDSWGASNIAESYYQALNQVYDPCIHKYTPSLKKALKR